ncbi:peptidoglycan recognition protein family protein [Microbacterium sp. YY-01]|uniref:peptidoglycan recognition protein family protein n=1 Tax=Microbacterium sp. YY-01 TaxID=3421634 RepID=UPI003D185E25
MGINQEVLMAEYKAAARAGLSPNRDRRQGKIRLLIVHHYGSTQSPEAAWKRFNSPNDRSVSPNYQINADGSAYEVVPPRHYRAWTTGVIDHQAVTCETQNTSGEPNWGISRASLEAIAQLFAWVHQEFGVPLQRGRVNSDNTVAVPGIVGHNETPAGKETSTICPGPSMDIPWIIARAKQIVNPKPTIDLEDEDTMTRTFIQTSVQGSKYELLRDGSKRLISREEWNAIRALETEAKARGQEFQVIVATVKSADLNKIPTRK